MAGTEWEGICMPIIIFLQNLCKSALYSHRMAAHVRGTCNFTGRNVQICSGG